MHRRDLLKRAPAVPFAVGAAATQAPGLLQRWGAWLTQRGYALPMGPTEETLEQRITWFTNGLKWIDKPTRSLPFQGEQLTVESMRAVVQWENYAERVLQHAKSYGIPLDEAGRIAGVVLHGS